ncbi:phosphoglycerate kinase [Candidatus Daviesbacteria bacterium]|nr:phosphoglycerate kinase [Candidatus Daviesbacteria bacterium]
MQTVTPSLIQDKRVLLRLDMDVVLQETGGEWEVGEQFRLEAGAPTLEMCLTHAKSVVVMGHLGRPKGQKIARLSVKPVAEWLKKKFTQKFQAKLDILENLRFDPREEPCDEGFAKELADMGDFFVNESFAAYRPAASTTVLPKLLPHAAGLRFAKEVGMLTKVRENPSKPLVVIMGGAKVEDKLPVIEAMAKIADAVLVGGKLPLELNTTPRVLPPNVLVGKLNEAGMDIAQETVDSWKSLIGQAKMIVWNGPVGFVEQPENDKSRKIAELVIQSRAESIIGGGDTVAYLAKLKFLDQFKFVSTGGGAMLEFLAKGTLPTIQALE